MSVEEFLSLLEAGEREFEEYLREENRFLSAFGEDYIKLPVPELPRVSFTVRVSFEIPFEATVPFPLFNLESVEAVSVEVAAEWERIRITIVTNGVQSLRMTVSSEMNLAKFIGFLLVHRALLQRGVDIFGMIEEKVGWPGLLSELRGLLELALSLLEGGEGEG
ncbi:MAG: hypothetical protein QXT28_08380 [Thermofilaceae archaeon]